MNRPAIFAAAFCCATSLSLGQVETTQYFMNSLPQVVEGNPAFVPKYSFALGLPMSRIGVMYTNNGFAYNDITRVENGKRILDLTQWQSVLPEKTYAVTATQADLFRLGLKLGNGFYLSIHSSARGYAQTMLPKDLATLLSGGTGPFIGQTANLSPTAHGVTFWESGVGVSVAASDKLRMGFRLKKLYGVAGATTEISDVSLSVDENYGITAAAGLHVKTSGARHLMDGNEPVFSDYIQNSGWSGDLGVTYKPMSRLTLAASIVDVGSIKWRSNLYDYVLDKATANYSFTGIDVQDLLEGNTDYSQELDSLQEIFTPTEVEGSSFRTAIPSKMYLSGTFDITRSFTVGGLLFAEQFMGRTATGMTASLNKHFGRVLSTSVSYTLSNRSTNNLGAGISFNFTPVQMYIVGDNLLRVPFSLASTGYINEFMNSTQVFNLRFGINFVWGWKKETAAVNNSAETAEEDRSKPYNNSKKTKSKPMSGNSSDSYNPRKSSATPTSNVKKHPKSKRIKQPAHIRLRQKSKP